jgi:signal transduction histidine kinase
MVDTTILASNNPTVPSWRTTEVVEAASQNQLRLALTMAMRRLASPSGRDHPRSQPRSSTETGTGPLGDSRRHRQQLYGRLAAVFFVGSGVLGLVTLKLPAPGLSLIPTAIVSAAAVVIGIAVWLAPWDRWPARASLAIVPPAFALIALGNAYGGSEVHTYGVFFVLAFVWIGMAQPPWTSLLVAPLAAAAYVLPLLYLPGDQAAGLSSALVTIPVCVLVGEGISVGKTRLDHIERAWQRERDRSEQMRELDAMKDEFLSAVSHELRTPITICRGHLDVLEDQPGHADVQGVKELLVNELDLMGRLVEDLVTLVQVGDRLVLRIESLPVNDFVSGIASAAAPILGDRLRVESDAVAGDTLRADPQRLTQALLNLLRNAADHGHGEGPVLLRAVSKPASWRFEVADEGGGLPPGEERVVFEAFSTGSAPTGRTGLGLSIVQRITRAHGGESGVSNRPGRGATFWIRIPG